MKRKCWKQICMLKKSWCRQVMHRALTSFSLYPSGKALGLKLGASLFEGLRGSPYFFSLLHAAHRRNRLSLFNSLNGWCLGSRASVCPTVSCHWHQSTQPLSVSSPVGPAWQGFPSEVWNLDWEGGRVGSTSWQLHNLPKQTHTYYKSDFTLDLPAAAELCH